MAAAPAGARRRRRRPGPCRPCGRPASTSEARVRPTARAAAGRAARGRRRGRATSTPTACRAGSTGPRAPRAGLVVHLHGGGFVFNDIDVHDAAGPPARRTAPASRCSASTTGGRPSTAFPAAPDDVDTVLALAGRARPSLGRPGRRTSTATAPAATSRWSAALRHPGRFAAVALIYPFLDPTAGVRRPTRTARRRLRPARGAWYWQQYAAAPADLTDPDLAPLLSDRLGTAAADPGRHRRARPAARRGRAPRALLAEAGVEVTATRYLGPGPRLLAAPAAFDAAEPLMRQVAGFLRRTADRGTDRMAPCACTSAPTTPASSSRTTCSTGSSTTATSPSTTARSSTTPLDDYPVFCLRAAEARRRRPAGAASAS